MTDTRTIYTAHDIPDLIATLPTLFGFVPTESLIGIATSGERRRFGFRLRVDMPGAGDIDVVAELVTRHLKHQEAEGAILVAVTERHDVAGPLLRAIEGMLDPVHCIVSVHADGARYWTTEPGSPAEGAPYTPSDHHLAVVHAIAAGQEILPDRQALVDRFRPVGGPRRQWLMQASETVLERVLPVLSRTPDHELGAVGRAVIGPILDRGLAREGAIDDDDLVRLFVWSSSIRVRDEVWARIRRENATAMLQLLTHVSRQVVPPYEPAILTLTAFTAWLTGDGAQALIIVERALAADPDYSMAQLMMELVEGGVSPAHWRSFSTD